MAKLLRFPRPSIFVGPEDIYPLLMRMLHLRPPFRLRACRRAIGRVDGAAKQTAEEEAHAGFVVASGLAAVFAELNLKPDAHAKSLACAAQWLEDIGVRCE